MPAAAQPDNRPEGNRPEEIVQQRRSRIVLNRTSPNRTESGRPRRSQTIGQSQSALQLRIRPADANSAVDRASAAAHDSAGGNEARDSCACGQTSSCGEASAGSATPSAKPQTPEEKKQEEERQKKEQQKPSGE